MNLSTEEKISAYTKYHNVQLILATIATFAFFAIVGYIIVAGLTNLTKDSAFIIGNLTGIAGSIVKDVYGYYFGSSIGSKEKSDQLEQINSQLNKK